MGGGVGNANECQGRFTVNDRGVSLPGKWHHPFSGLPGSAIQSGFPLSDLPRQTNIPNTLNGLPGPGSVKNHRAGL